MNQPQPYRGQTPAEIFRVRARSLATPVVGAILISLLFAVLFLIDGPTESNPATSGDWLLLAIAFAGFIVAATCGVGARLLFAMADAAEAAILASEPAKD